MQDSNIEIPLNDSPEEENPSTIPLDLMEKMRTELALSSEDEQTYYREVVDSMDWVNAGQLSPSQQQYALSEYHKLEGNISDEDKVRIAETCKQIGMFEANLQAKAKAAAKPKRCDARRKNNSNRNKLRKLQKAARKKGRK